MIPKLRSVLFGKGDSQQPAAAQRPTEGKVYVKGSLKGTGKLKDVLQSLSIFQKLEGDGDSVGAMIIESTDRNRKPHLYISFRFASNWVEAKFSIPPEVPNPSMRKLEATRTLFTVVSLLEARGVFLPDRNDLYQKTMEAFEAAAGFAGMDSMAMKYRLDTYTAENSVMKAELTRLKAEKEGLNHSLMELERRCQELDERVRTLEGLTDAELDREIVRWVEEHNSKLNAEKFCASAGIGGKRLEERLDSLSKRGVIRLA